MLVIANWKENLTFNEVKKWVNTFNTLSGKYKFKQTNVVVCPSYLFINYLKDNLCNAEIGAQDVSQHKEGAYTGEVSALQLKDFTSYSIAGHSERRENFNETDNIVLEKANKCKESSIIPVVCISNSSQLESLKSEGNIVIAYEPIENIGTGTPESKEEIEKMVNEVKNINQSFKVIYGGSVSEDNIKSLSHINNLEGFLVGADSLNVNNFFNICKICDTLI